MYINRGLVTALLSLLFNCFRSHVVFYLYIFPCFINFHSPNPRYIPNSNYNCGRSTKKIHLIEYLFNLKYLFKNAQQFKKIKDTQSTKSIAKGKGVHGDRVVVLYSDR